MSLEAFGVKIAEMDKTDDNTLNTESAMLEYEKYEENMYTEDDDNGCNCRSHNI